MATRKPKRTPKRPPSSDTRQPSRTKAQPILQLLFQALLNSFSVFSSSAQHSNHRGGDHAEPQRKQTLSPRSFRYSKKGPQNFLATGGSFIRRVSQGLIFSLERGLDRVLLRLRWQQSGIILPVVTIVLLMLTAVTGSVLLQSTERTTEVVGQRQDQTVYNLASPAIDRAKAKIEYLFEKDDRLPASTPPEITLKCLMRDEAVGDGSGNIDPMNPECGSLPGISMTLPGNPYTLPDETRININGDTELDNAWYYQRDLDGDGTNETIAYSIVMNSEDDAASVDLNSPDADKAANLVTRAGPLAINSGSGISDTCNIPSLQPEQGWYALNAATLRKNFQVNAVVVSENSDNRAVTALEFQQDREISRGNTLGVYFRYDLELYPGETFFWNGAMHTEGNALWGGVLNGDATDVVTDDMDDTAFFARLISSPSSCIYTQQSSDITIGLQQDPDTGAITFQGQMITANPEGNNFDGETRIDLFPDDAQAPNTDDPMGSNNKAAHFQQVVDRTNDSVDINDSTPTVGSPYDNSLDPIVLFTTGGRQSRGADPTNITIRATNWDTQGIANRIQNSNAVPQPILDDTYRADDRLGPTPVYRLQEGSEIAVPSAADYGGEIASNGTLTTDEKTVLTRRDVTPDFIEGLGLDGFWERRARIDGLRIIVGQRLEFGNAYGWTRAEDADSDDVLDPGEDLNENGILDDGDPLYPPNQTMTNLERQRRSLRDNLAAVQAAAVYHYENDSDFPVACLAVTGHNGTPTLRDNSRNFQTDPDNFLEGSGTNGWEFAPPAADETAFINSIDSSTDPLRIALTNLAYFAGDPFGAFPPMQDGNGTNAVTSVGAVVHPFPHLAMWGDFSELRRVIEKLNAGVTYTNLSIADKTTLHTAACTLGMLAYNIEQVERPLIDASDDTLDITDFTEYIFSLVDGTDDPGNGEVNSLCTTINPACGTPLPAPFDRLGNLTPTDESDDGSVFYAQFGRDDYISAINNDGNLNAMQKDDYVVIATNLDAAITLQDDRLLGFGPGPFLASSLFPPGYGAIDSSATWDLSDPAGPETGSSIAGGGIPGAQGSFETTCDPDRFDPAVKSSAVGRKRKKVALALLLCSPEDGTRTRKYPSLYYLFPYYNHDQIGELNGLENGPANDITFDNQPTTEEYINQPYIFNTTATDDVNHGLAYGVLSGVEGPFVTENVTLDGGVSLIAIDPHLDPTPGSGDWELPTTTTASLSGNSIVDRGGTTRYVPFLEKAFYDGRQYLQVRSLDIDLDLLADNTVTSDNWLPASGVVYGFREDAVREDAIARPATTTWGNCDTEAELDGTDCRMDLTVPQDPPVNANNGVSPKPVDFYPDPDRRPHGFRLTNGKDISRSGTDSGGLTFISDNSVYIQGDFNLHSTNGTTSALQEEFDTVLNSTWSNFYERDDLNINNFAKTSVDRWRPSEIMGDAITILSDDFCDGTLEDGMRALRNGVSGSGCGTNSSSYLNSVLTNNVLPSGFDLYPSWVREDSNSNDLLDAAILVDRNAEMRQTAGSLFTATYRPISTSRNLVFSPATDQVDATDVRINATLINALVPSRERQSYGGLHNFPRLLQSWKDKNLRINGSFLQLNFSTAATAPYDQEDWESNVTADPTDSIVFEYYRPPNRLWGYDVALQYAPASPLAERSNSSNRPRSEYYQELAADDEYIKQLRCTVISGSDRIDPALSAGDC